ncbi:TrbG/VirB9 family P-type conjugative transfer protein [Sphingopyxis sp. NFH-91]|uniref:TrbG/VirB9 family P-type conjugative transfer protein n=1 Tax=Sphingopyxis sp. NFH-91 TaxID=2744457 RepID=UPI001F3AAFBC|nr:TrbG/VirB9 family P-type conjugative transfer protein [Sphingopyxis sp. NFH-91]
MIGRLVFLGSAFIGLPAAAQVQPAPNPGGDQRMQTVDYHRYQVVEVRGAPGYQTLIALAPDERIQNVAVGDSGAWQVAASQSGNMLFVRPAQEGVATNMTVITSARFYAFDLVPTYGTPPYEIRFRYPAEPDSGGAAGAAMGEPVGQYRLSGTKTLWPARMSDDGAKTFIEWPAELPLPAVFFIDDYGRERLANGNMRAGHYVLDGVHRELLFRIDRKTARAKRYIPKEPKQ